MNRYHRKKRGQGITELAFGAVILVPIMLLFYDLAVFALAKQTLDSCVKDATRAAANQATANDANAAVADILKDIKPNPYITSVTKKSLQWNLTDAKGERVTVVLEMKGHFPVPLPGMPKDYTLSQHGTEPIVGIPLK